MGRVAFAGAVSVLLLGVYMTLHGCGSPSSVASDAAAPDASAGSPAIVPTPDAGQSSQVCDPVTQTGCPVGARCAIFCDGASAVLGCEPDPGAGPGIGEQCDGLHKCSKGVCLDGQSPGPSRQCVPFCSGDANCVAPHTCESLTLSYRCTASSSSNIKIMTCH